LEDQIAVWAEEFHVSKFEVWLQNRDVGHGTSNTKTMVDFEKARSYVLGWRQEWERTGRTPSIKIRPV
jgi:sucrose-6-phosphate hydrolase SacC (GH32 family)